MSAILSITLPICLLIALGWLAARKQWFSSSDLELQRAAVLMAAMPMLGIDPIIAQRYGLEGPSAAALLGTTLASFFSLGGWLWFLQDRA